MYVCVWIERSSMFNKLLRVCVVYGMVGCGHLCPHYSQQRRALGYLPARAQIARTASRAISFQDGYV